MNIDKLVSDLAAPMFNYRMASGLLGQIDSSIRAGGRSAMDPVTARLNKSAKTRLANAEKAIERIVKEAVSDAPK